MQHYDRFENRDTPADIVDLLGRRQSLDRRTLEEAFLLFASLEVLHKYELPLRDVPCNRNKLAETITETFHDAFVARWGGECMSPSELLNFVFNLFVGFTCEKVGIGLNLIK